MGSAAIFFVRRSVCQEEISDGPADFAFLQGERSCLRRSDAHSLTGAGGLVGGEEGAQDCAAFGAGQTWRAAVVECVDEVAGGVDEALLPAGGDVVEGTGLAIAVESEGRSVGEAVS